MAEVGGGCVRLLVCFGVRGSKVARHTHSPGGAGTENTLHSRHGHMAIAVSLSLSSCRFCCPCCCVLQAEQVGQPGQARQAGPVGQAWQAGQAGQRAGRASRAGQVGHAVRLPFVSRKFEQLQDQAWHLVQ